MIPNDVKQILEAIAGIGESVGMLARQMSDHERKDDERFARLENKLGNVDHENAEITGQHKIDKALADQIERLNAQAEAKIEASRARRAVLVTAIVASIASALAASVIAVFVGHVAWR